jgi:glycosyltransferase involved in cell wall biosynthesis
MKLSIIVPVYNVELYIERCIRSLEQQDIPEQEYEIIIVNDGTQDHSVHIINKLCSEYTNIILVEKENGGLSSARNYGIKYAKGEYIWFVDSDDYIEPNILNNILSKSYELCLDLLAFNYCHIWPHKKIQGFNPRLQPTNKIISGETYIQKYPIGISAWFFIVKREIIIQHNISFIEGIIHEDYEFTLHLFQYINKMTFKNINAYNYFHREGSITTSRGYQQVIKSIHSWQSIILSETKRYNNKNSYESKAIQWVNNHKFYGINRLFFAKIPFQIKREEYEKLKSLGAFNIGKNHLNLERKFRCFLLCQPWLYKTFMRCF